MELTGILGLAIETAIGGGSLAIFNRASGSVLAVQNGNSTKSRSEDILENLLALLKEYRINKNSINLIVHLTEAGSMTGLKIGEAIAKGLAKSLTGQYREISLWDVLAKNTEGRNRIFYLPAAKNRIVRRILENNNFEKNNQIISFELFQKELGTENFLIDKSVYIYEGLLDSLNTSTLYNVLNKNLAEYACKSIASDNE